MGLGQGRVVELTLHLLPSTRASAVWSVPSSLEGKLQETLFSISLVPFAPYQEKRASPLTLQISLEPRELGNQVGLSCFPIALH